MSTIVIVEGVDRSGKTTVANALSKALNVPVFRNKEFGFENEYHGRGAVYETQKMWLMLNMVETFDADVIFDRLHLSEYVYGMIERGYINNNVWKIDDRLASLDAIVVHVKPYDIESSSLLHGKDLKEYDHAFDWVVKYATCCDVVTGTMLDVDKIVHDVQELVKSKK
jgi:hypothetical protein